MRSDNTKLAIIYSIIASFFYAIGGLLVKTLAVDIPNPVIIFFRQVFSLCFVLPILYFELPTVKKLKTSCFPLHLLRVFSSLLAMYCLYYALKYLPLVDVLLLTYTRPLFIPIIVLFWFGKKWKKNTFFGLIIGFLGVILILKPTQRVFDIAALVGLASGLFGALAFTSIRRLTKTEFPNKILFYYLVLSIPVASVILTAGWMPLSWPIIGVLALIGAIATIYQICLTRAYRHAKAYQVGSYLYSAVIFGAIFDWIFLKDLSLGIPAIIGMILVFLGSLVVMKSGAGKVSPTS